MSNEGTPSVAIHTNYTICHLEDRSYCASNISFEIGAVVINEKDEILIFEDLESDIGALPRLAVDSEAGDVSSCNTSPLEFIRDQAGLDVERLPLLKPIRRYKNPDAERWRDLRAELTFEQPLTTSPFFVSLDISWFSLDADPEFLDGRQAVVNWYAGIVRGAPAGPYERVCRALGVRFVPLAKAIVAVSEHDYAAECALRAFDAVWAATERLRSER